MMLSQQISASSGEGRINFVEGRLSLEMSPDASLSVECKATMIKFDGVEDDKRV